MSRLLQDNVLWFLIYVIQNAHQSGVANPVFRVTQRKYVLLVLSCVLVLLAILYFSMVLNVYRSTQITWYRTSKYGSPIVSLGTQHNALQNTDSLQLCSNGDCSYSRVYYNLTTLNTLTEVFYSRCHWVTGLGFYGNQSATQASKMRIQLLCSQDKQCEAKWMEIY